MNCSNHAPDIICENAAISCIDETLYLQDPGLGHWGFRTNTELGLNGIPVRAVSVESVEKLFPESDLFIVKIDIEGGESRLFESNLKWVSRTMVIIIELHDRLFLRCANSQNCLKALSEHPRDIFFSGENILSIRND
jgi:FkbM family methyltransferase